MEPPSLRSRELLGVAECEELLGVAECEELLGVAVVGVSAVYSGIVQ